MPCRQSRDTVVPVSRCPRNKIEWITRADILNCSFSPQTCVVPEKFQYHCVLNEIATGLVEVCAPFKTIHGNKHKHLDYPTQNTLKSVLCVHKSVMT